MDNSESSEERFPKQAIPEPKESTESLSSTVWLNASRLECNEERLSEAGPSREGASYKSRPSYIPEGLIADQSLAQAIRDQALLLPPLYQKVLDLYYFQGKRLGEISKICDRSEEEIARVHAQCALAVQLAMKHYRPR